MKKIILIICLLLGTTAMFAGGGTLKGSGRIVTETREAKSFNSIKVSNMIHVTIGNNTDGKIVVKADDNVMPYVKTRFEGLNLVIKIESPYQSLRNINVDVQLPYSKNIRNLDAHGAAVILAESPIESYELDIDASGAGKVKLSNVKVTKMEVNLSGASELVIPNLSAKECEVDLSGASKASLAGLDSFKFDGDISGASNLTVKGASASADIDASGASEMNAGDFIVKNYEVDLSGASRAKINCVGVLSGEVSSASNLSYVGNPKMNVSTSSAGRISAGK